MLNYQILSHYGLISDQTSTFSENISIQCLYHEDISPSLTVSDEFFNCWACHASGRLFDLVMHLESLQRGIEIDEWETICLIAKIKKEVSEQENKVVEMKSKITEKEAIVYSSQFISSLKEPKWEYIENSLLKRAFYPSTLREFGVRINTSGSHPNVIPIRQNGFLKGYIARRENELVNPKYIYNKGFKKSKVVGGTIKKGDVLIVEGYLDMMKAYQHGWKNTVCIFGWHISKDQTEFIKSFATSIIDGLDNDDAGRLGSERLKEVFSDIPIYKFPVTGKDIGGMQEKDFEYSIYNIA